MGFGLLLAGYIAAFLMSMTLYGWAIRILGCIVMILGCRKLHEYFRGFAYVEGAAALVALTGIAEGVFYVTERINSAVPDIVKTVEGWAWFAVVLLFHLLLGWELNLAAKAVGIEKPRTTALTSMVTAVIWALTYALGIMKLIEPGFYYVLLLVLIVLSAVAIYGCYKNICPAGQENAPLRRKTRIGFIDRFFEKVDEKEARALETTRAEIEERQRRRAESRKSKRKK